MKSVRFGIIGAGLMGREFASAAARWCHLTGLETRPEIVAVCNRSAGPMEWFQQNFPSVAQVTQNYRELLANPRVDAVYVAVPHHLHQEIDCAALDAGKHLMAEKPFGIDLQACEAIHARVQQHRELLVRCASQWMFYPGAQRIADLAERGAFGRIIEVSAGFLHSSDMDAQKPINWKRRCESNGEYGVMGDLGMHVCSLPFRAGWIPRNVRAVLSKIVTERPDGRGGTAPCDTWDNATLLCEAADPSGGGTFPLTIKTHRMAPGEKNTWFLEVMGTRVSARYSTRDPKRLEVLDYRGGEQVWGTIQLGYETPFRTITGAIFEFGAPDALLQMWAAYLYELENGKPVRRFAGCITPDEALLSHQLFTAALESHRESRVMEVPQCSG